jgi:hypothetical protein
MRKRLCDSSPDCILIARTRRKMEMQQPALGVKVPEAIAHSHSRYSVTRPHQFYNLKMREFMSMLQPLKEFKYGFVQCSGSRAVYGTGQRFETP